VFSEADWAASGMEASQFAEKELKGALEGLAKHLFGEVECRWGFRLRGQRGLGPLARLLQGPAIHCPPAWRLEQSCPGAPAHLLTSAPPRRPAPPRQVDRRLLPLHRAFL
jgi:hypothetical protein